MKSRLLFPWFSLLLFLPMLGGAQIDPDFSPIPASFDINSSNPLYALDVPYDNIDPNRQAFHLFLPDNTESYPLVIYIHGGGFTGGSRDVVLDNQDRLADIKFFLEQGIAYASIGYRLLETNGPDEEGVIKCLSDSKRALQFIRYYADDLNIDPTRIVLSGSSAGAGTSLWLGTRSDMADPNAQDPILQSSTRVCAVALSASQSTYDLHKWESEVYLDFDGQGTNFTADSMVNVLGFERFSNFYGGVDSVEQMLSDPDLIQYREDVDMLFHMSDDDPPIHFRNASGAVHPSQDLFHHSLHGVVIYENALAANISEVKADIPAQAINTTDGESRNDFLVRHLNACMLPSSVKNPVVSERLDIYPNPAWGAVTIQVNEGSSISSLSLFTLSGQLVLEEWEVNARLRTLALDELDPGMYLLRVVSQNGGILNQKLIVQ